MYNAIDLPGVLTDIAKGEQIFLFSWKIYYSAYYYTVGWTAA
jgi:hypothetical protein